MTCTCCSTAAACSPGRAGMQSCCFTGADQHPFCKVMAHTCSLHHMWSCVLCVAASWPSCAERPSSSALPVWGQACHFPVTLTGAALELAACMLWRSCQQACYASILGGSTM